MYVQPLTFKVLKSLPILWNLTPINQALMELIKENMSHMVDMASQWRQGMGQGNKDKMSEAHSGMMHHG